MKKKSLLVLLGLVAIGSYLLGTRAMPASAQATARCKVSIPQSWGEFMGSSDSFGLVFKDSSGSLRFVRQLPCGLDGTPTVAVEVQRN